MAINDTNKQWEQFLSPEVTRDRLISGAMYITAYELLKDSIVGRIRDFYISGFSEGKEIVSEEYQSRVLSRKKSVLYASLDWLLESEVIDQADLVVFERVKTARNSIAHEFPELVLGGRDQHVGERFLEVASLLRKIEVWWVVNFELAINPDYNDVEVDEEKIIPGPVLMLQLMTDVISGNTEYLDHFREKQRKSF